MSSGILLKCHNNETTYFITKHHAMNSKVLKEMIESNHEGEIVISGENCEEGLPIVNYLVSYNVRLFNL